ncbi:alpha/beta fold hydrolase [Halobacterium wangiae]|uniref:alpha/beta fold hydrolase n=1 Tax=Halobacterium wangiae TaxID=2902623 RepID=UPI001E5C4EEF|nr:alpha/beta hydrolase [Halobacterium wangiae]
MPTVQTGDIETHYEQRGTGPPIVFVHGALSDHTAAAQQLRAFGDDYTAIAYDLRGHGRTTNPHDTAYSIDQLAEDLHEFVDALGLNRPVLCGVSMGGMIAQVYASRYPDRLGGLVLADTFTPTFVSRRDRIERTVLTNVLVGLVRVVGYGRARALVLWFGRKLEGDNTSSLRVEAFPEMDTVAAVNSLQAVASFHETDVDLAAITVPTLVLYGEHEASVVSRHASTLAAGIPDVTVREVPDAGHASPWDNPAFFERAIREFLAQVERPTD